MTQDEPPLQQPVENEKDLTSLFEAPPAPDAPISDPVVDHTGLDPEDTGFSADQSAPPPSGEPLELPQTVSVAGEPEPFHLWIDGALSESERARLIEMVEKADIGIRGVDLEAQFQVGQVLLPRITEFLAVLIIHTLRDASVRFRLLPSDQGDTDGSASSESLPSTPMRFLQTEDTPSVPHPAENIPVSTLSEPGSSGAWEAVDALHASTLLPASASSAEMTRTTELLKRELRYKAHHKKSSALIGFHVQAEILPSGREVRVTATATAVRYLTP